ncbi:MAG: cytochrome c [Planctomycetota bacterium]
MKRHPWATKAFAAAALGGALGLISCGGDGDKDGAGPVADPVPYALLPEQTPSWSEADRDFFLHGSMGTEFLPEVLLRAWAETEPGLIPSATLVAFGAVAERADGLPLGFSLRRVEHLGGLPSLGINCASCHAGQVVPPGGGAPITLLGQPAPFDAEAFFGAVVVAMVKTADPEAMKKFLPAYARARLRRADAQAVREMEELIAKDMAAIAAAVKEDPLANRGAAAGAMHVLGEHDLDLFVPGTTKLVPLPDLARNLLRLLHNMRAALHIPDALPAGAPPASGPGRNDAFGLLSLVLLGTPQEYAPVKFGVVWNVDRRRWVHWDGNTPSPMARNLLAAVGLGAPLLGKKAVLDVAVLKRQTQLSETIRPPKYPWQIDEAAAKRGEAHYRANCASCHDGPESDARLHAVAEVGTDPARARAFTQKQADGFNGFLRTVQVENFDASKEPAIRGTGKYWASALEGVWARAPYLHNGSVRTMADLLSPPASRPKTWRRGSREYDASGLGYADAGPHVLDTTTPGNSNAGHDYGTALPGDAKRDLIEFLKAK